MKLINDIPVEVLVDQLLPAISLQALLRLSCTSKFLARVISDETFWKRKLEEDYNFTGAGIARTSGWRFIYRGLHNPRVFVWGGTGDGRLGLDEYPQTGIFGGVPYPVELKINAKVVALVAGGMSFHALDSKGDVYVWGTLDGTPGAARRGRLGFVRPGQMAQTPLRLQLPAVTRRISCGRLHSSTFDTNGDIYTLTSWGRPFRLPMLTDRISINADNALKQLECGWSFSSVLTRSGEVLIWWPFSGPIRDCLLSSNESFENRKAKVSVTNKVIRCEPFDIEGNMFRTLPPIPSLPVLKTSDEQNGRTRLIQIAGLENLIIGLTNHGHVLKFGTLEDESNFDRASWEYLPHFSELDLIKKDSVFSSKYKTPPSELHITHVTGNFRTFTAYSSGSSSYLLMGSNETNAMSRPKIIPELQGRDIISTVQGDWHDGALTLQGNLLTWGGYGSGSLGLGDPMEMEPGRPGAFATEQDRASGWPLPSYVDTPTEVRFDHTCETRKDRFCFSVTAAGHHMGALVIDLEPGE